MKWVGMLVVSLRGVNFGFWSHLGCSVQNAIIFSRKGLFKGCTRRNIKKLCIFNSFYLLDSCNQSLKWSLLGVKKRLGHAQIGLLLGFNSKFPTSIPTPFICGVLPGGFAPFWSGNGYTLFPFWSGIGYDFWGNWGVYERIYRFNSKWEMRNEKERKKEKYSNWKWIWKIFFFAL